MPSAFTAAGLILSLVGAPFGPPAATHIAITDPVALGRVVILPLLDHSGVPERSATKIGPSDPQATGDQGREAALAAVEAEFRMRGIEYVRRAELAAALAALKLDPAREEERAPARLKVLAGALKADVVLTGVIEQASAGWRRRGVLGEGTAEARVRFRLFDARTGREMDGVELTGTSDARAKTPPTRSDSRLQKLRAQAVREATTKALAAFLQPYPPLYSEDPGEAFVVYATRPDAEGRAKPAAPAPDLPKTPVLFKLVGGGEVEGRVEKFEYGIYTVMTAKGRVYLGQEHVLAMTPKP